MHVIEDTAGDFINRSMCYCKLSRKLLLIHIRTQHNGWVVISQNAPCYANRASDDVTATDDVAMATC